MLTALEQGTLDDLIKDGGRGTMRRNTHGKRGSRMPDGATQWITGGLRALPLDTRSLAGLAKKGYVEIGYGSCAVVKLPSGEFVRPQPLPRVKGHDLGWIG